MLSTDLYNRKIIGSSVWEIGLHLPRYMPHDNYYLNLYWLDKNQKHV